jgi:hypothetical protein
MYKGRVCSLKRSNVQRYKQIYNAQKDSREGMYMKESSPPTYSRFVWG